MTDDASTSRTDDATRLAVARHRPLSRLAVAALGLALGLALLGALAGLGSRWGWWHFRTGFSLLRWSVYGSLLALPLSLLALALTRPGQHRRGLPLALLALAISLAMLVVPMRWQRTARAAPPIHDITTDTDNPPRFVAVLPLRADAPNPVEYGGPEIAAQQRQAYPDLRPLVLEMPADAAFRLALDAAHDMGWEIVAVAPEEGRIEATDQTFWFGFKDDVVIRLTPLDGRTVVDVRSVSRVGRGDAGTNARRVRAYLERLDPR